MFGFRKNEKAKEVCETNKYDSIVFVNSPISSEKDDAIGFESQIQTLSNAIDSGSNMIGIIADYGTGKSSMTKLLDIYLHEKSNSKEHKTKYTRKPIKINMWDCMQNDQGEKTAGVSDLTKSFLFQLSHGHNTKFGSYINKLLSKNYGNISFGVNTKRFWVFFALAAFMYSIYKVLSIGEIV